jgi:hypothetical protein
MKKLFLLFFVSLCFGIIAVVLWPGPAYAQPPGCAPVAANLAMCHADLDTCEDDLAACEAQPDAPVAQTGQTTCWNSSGTDIVCANTGQDGDVQAGVVPPTPRFTDNLDGTITDNLTGLIWLKNANCFGLRTWAQALTDANTLNSGECGLTDGSIEGDWYLPNRNELMSLLDLGKSNPALPTGHPFENFQSFFYWSSTTFANFPDFAWSVGFNFGFVGNSFKFDDTLFFVLPVRGGS